MKQITKISDNKNSLAYNTVLLGVLLNDHKVVEQGISAGAKTDNIQVKDRFFGVDRSDEDESEADEESKYISLEQYARSHSSGLVYESLIRECKNFKEYKKYAVIKILYSYAKKFSRWECYKKRPEVDFSEGLEVLKKYVNKSNVNDLVEIYSYAQPLRESRWDTDKGFTTSILNYACYSLNEVAVDYLLSIGADVNLTVKNKDNRGASVVAVIKGTPEKGDQSVSLRILRKLIDKKANFNIVSDRGVTGWECAVNRFKVPQLRDLFKDYQPDDLKVIEKIKQKSPNLYTYWTKQSKGFSKYPLINDLAKFENRSIDLVPGFEDIPKVESFFKNKSIKDALKKRYGTESKQLTASFTEKLFSRKDNEELGTKTATVNPACFVSADILKDIFLVGDKPNFSDFVEVFKQLDKSEDFGINRSYEKYQVMGKKLSKFLNLNFQPNQIKEILLNKEKLNDDYSYDFDDTNDIIDMFFRHEKEFSVTLKNTPFKNLNSLEKIHDVLSAEIEILDQSNYELNQEKHYPKLLNIPKIELPQGYSIKIAKENHELIRWGAMMGHCIGGGSYAESAAQGECILLAINQDDTPKYAVEISDRGEISQVQGKSRTVPDKPVMEAVVAGLKKIGVVNQKQSAKRWVR